MRNYLDLKRMRYIVEVAHAEAITTAAQVLNISQPALTRNIAEVEEELGIQIFHRLPRGIQLTEEGRNFVSRAKRIIDDVDDLSREVGEHKTVPSGRLRVGFTPSGYLGFGSSVLIKLAEQHPGVGIETSTGTPQNICPKLLHGELDLIIGSSSYLQRWRELEVKKLVPLKFCCVFRKEHPISEINGPTELDVLKYPVILPASIEPMLSDIAQRYVDLELPRLKPHYVTDDFLLALDFIRCSDAFYPLTGLDPTFSDLSEHFFLLREAVEIPEHHVSIAYSPHRPKSAVTKLFEDLIATELS